MAIVLVLLTSYFAGSFPTSYLLGRLLKGIDIRDFGSGNVGATNTFRVLGPGPGVLVFLIDMAKGAVPVCLITPYIADCMGGLPPAWLKIFSGICAIAGHNWSIFLKFRGGKGVATSVGVLLGISAKSLGLSAGVWVLVTGFFRYVSLGSIAAAVSLPVFMWLGGEDKATLFFGIAVALLIVVKHRSNITRLVNHTEKKIGLGSIKQ